MIKNNQFFTNKKNIKNWLDTRNIKDYTIHDDLVVDVKDAVVELGHQNLSYLPIQFGKVEGNFYIANCNLKTLKGSPRYVTGFFDCSNNNLMSLDYAPEKVNDFDCSNNKISSFKNIHLTATNMLLIQENPIVNFNYKDIENIQTDIICMHSDIIKQYANSSNKLTTMNSIKNYVIVKFAEFKDVVKIEYEKALLEKNIQLIYKEHKVKL